MNFASADAACRRAASTGGISQASIYEMVAGFLQSHGVRDATVLDIACGQGNLRPYVAPYAAAYHGADVVRYPGHPTDVPFHEIDPESGHVALPDGTFDVVLSLETIEHLENPRAFARELVRLAKPGGWIVITTPNQLSYLSKLTLLYRNHFIYFGPNWYPSHLTALLEIDLRRIAGECGLRDVEARYGNPERIIFTASRLPQRLVRVLPRAFSANVLVAGRKPAADDSAPPPALS